MPHMPSTEASQPKLSRRASTDAMVTRNIAHDELGALFAALQTPEAAGFGEAVCAVVTELATDYWRALRDLCRAYDQRGTITRDANRGDVLPDGRTVTVCFAKRVGRYGSPNSIRWTVKLSDGTELREPPIVDTGISNWTECRPAPGEDRGPNPSKPMQVVGMELSAADLEDAATPRKGKRVRVVRGRKVPRGTEGVVIWLGVDDWGKARLGLKDADGNAHWTAASNVEVIGTH